MAQEKLGNLSTVSPILQAEPNPFVAVYPSHMLLHSRNENNETLSVSSEALQAMASKHLTFGQATALIDSYRKNYYTQQKAENPDFVFSA